MLSFIAGHSQMADQIRAHDWGATELGEAASWPESLKTLVSVMLEANQPMFIVWGPRQRLIYNDRYIAILQGHHPAAFGRPVLEAWSEIADDLRPMVDDAYAGRPTHMDDITLMMERNGYVEETHFAFSYTPIRREGGEVEGFFGTCIETTEQVKTARAVRESEVRNRQIFDSAIDYAIVATDLDGRVTSWNEGARRTLGWTEREMLGEPVDRFFTPEDVAGDRPQVEMREALETGRGTDERWHLRKNGERFWANGEMTVLRDAAERPVGYVKVLRDRTTEHQADQALRTAESRLRQAQEAGGVGLFTVDIANDVLYPTPEFCRLYGLPVRSDFPASAFEDRVVVDDRHLVSTGSARRSGAVHEEVEYRIRPHGSERLRWVARTGQIERDTSGTPIRFIGAARDVTARKEAEDAIRASEAMALRNIERVQLALSAGAIIGTWFWDLPSDRFTVDEAFALAFGLDPALGREGLSLEQVVATVHPDDQEGLSIAINEAIERGGAYAHQYRVRRADGRYYWIEANGRVDHAPDGTPLYFPGVLLDIEERRAVEQERDRAATELRDLNDTLEQRVAERTTELMRAEEQLRQSQKMEAVGQLTGGLAHDFNNLLTGITGSLEMMQVRLGQGRVADVDRYVAGAQGAAKRAAALTHRLLAFSRRQTLAPKVVDVNALVVGMDELIRRTVGPQIDLQTVAAPGLWNTMVDPSQLENALLNLCINARDAMPDGGRLLVETANREIDEAFGDLRDIEPGRYVALSVTDNGTGMPPDVVASAFDPFFTTKPMGEGTGLGLSMIYGFTRQSGGQVRIHSEVGSGTTVTIYLPRRVGAADEEGGDLSLAEAPRASGRETVLVVDDEPTVRLLVAEVLTDLGYLALEAAEGAGGLSILRSDAVVDLLVTDVGLPGGMNGRQLADAGRELRPGLKVLFITGFAENAVLSHGHLDPGMHILTKPFSMEALASRVRELITTPS